MKRLKFTILITLLKVERAKEFRVWIIFFPFHSKIKEKGGPMNTIQEVKCLWCVFVYCMLRTTHTHTPFTNTETKRPKLQKKRWVSVCYVYNLYIYSYTYTQAYTLRKSNKWMSWKGNNNRRKSREKNLGGSWIFVHLLAHFEWRQRMRKWTRTRTPNSEKPKPKWNNEEKIRPTEQNRAEHKMYGPWMIYYCILWKFLHSSRVCVQYTYIHSTAIKLFFAYMVKCVYVHYPDVDVFVFM